MNRIPQTIDEIDSAWLDEALAERYPGVRVSEVEILERHEVTNAHARLALRYQESAGAPASVFCKLLPTESVRREAIAATGMGPKEAQFYARLAPQLSMRVPDAHVARYDRDGSFVLLMEDLVVTGVGISDGPTSVEPDAASRALEDLAELHVRFEDPARRRAEAPWVPGPGPASDYGSTRLQVGLDHHRDKLTDAFAEMAEVYIAKRDAIHEVWHMGPHTVIHGDPHIGNLFDDDGRTGFLDWGIINVSTPLRDMSYFINMALSVAARRTHERDLIRHYLDVRAGLGGGEIGFDEAWKAHRLHAAYLVPASCQIVVFPEDATERRKIFAAAFLERASAGVEDLEARAALREHAGL
ncbi:ecdysteroid 22-kinase family protein [Myxococcota bacterium]|nr:ecdysteroid 22-kinase family protein [Myxococcota bacterium]